MRIFVDTSAFISLLLQDQINYHNATAAFEKLKEANGMFYTSNYILTESYTWLLYKNTIHVAKELRKMIDAAEGSGHLQVYWIDDLLHTEAWAYFTKFSEHKLSYTDVCSFLLIKKYGLDGIFTFDEGFKKVGLAVKP